MRNALIACLLLAGCATTPQSQAPQVTEAQRLRCDYEARAATAGIYNPFQAGFSQADLYQRCLRAADAANYEAGAKPSGGQPNPAMPAITNALPPDATPQQVAAYAEERFGAQDPQAVALVGKALARADQESRPPRVRTQAAREAEAALLLAAAARRRQGNG